MYTSIWSLVFRRNPDAAIVFSLSTLIDQARVKMIGAIRQEILSGIKAPKQYELIKNTVA